MKFKFSHHDKVKFIEALCFLVSFITIIYFFNIKYFLIALIFGWLFQGLGLCVTLHRLCTHKSFTPRNRLIKWILLFIANLGTVGSPIAWTATHRLHHKHADKLEDPTNPKGSVWHKFKNFFSHFKKLPTQKVCVKDLVADRDYLFFHKYYFQIIIFYVLLLSIINPIYIGYLYAIPVVYNVICIGWVSTLAHSPELSIFGYRNYNTDDNTYNSLVWQLITMGEGLHNNHHAKPNLWNTAIKKYEFDIASWFIRLLGKNNG